MPDNKIEMPGAPGMPEDNDFGHLMLRILGQNRKVARISAQIMAEVCQNWEDKHMEALFMLKTCSYNLGDPDKMYVSDLTRELHDTPQSVSRLLRMLEQEELIERHSDPEDRRKTYISFTETGERAVRDCWDRLEGIEEEIENHMGVEQLSRLCEDYAKMIRVMEAVTEEFRDPDRLRLPPLPPEKERGQDGRIRLTVEVPDASRKAGRVPDGKSRSAEEKAVEKNSAENKKRVLVPEDTAEKSRQDVKEDRKNKKRKKAEKEKKKQDKKK